MIFSIPLNLFNGCVCCNNVHRQNDCPLQGDFVEIKGLLFVCFVMWCLIMLSLGFFNFHIENDKFAHFFCFLVYSLLFNYVIVCPEKDKKQIMCFLFAVASAILSEFVQSLVPVLKI